MAANLGDVIPAALPEGNRWAWWRHHASVDPVDFEGECQRFVAMRAPCLVCGARQYLTPKGIGLDHDRDRHGADWVPPEKQGKRGDEE